MAMNVFLLDTEGLIECDYESLVPLCSAERKPNRCEFKNVDTYITKLGAAILIQKMKEYIIQKDPEIELTDLDVAYLVHGKPVFKKDKYVFNLSHSGHIIAVAFDYKASLEQKIGIDVELIKKHNTRIEKRFFTEKECSYIHCSAEDNDARFFEIWTRKEAVLKAHGDGLIIPLNSFEVVHSNEVSIDGETFFFHNLTAEKYGKNDLVICVASNDDLGLNDINIWYSKAVDLLNN